jgi:8-oxo-dGTP pyrophosphatase MutT (NUDIX family)
MTSPAAPSPADTQPPLQDQRRGAPAHFDPRQLPLAPAPAPHIALPAQHLQPDFLRQRFAHASARPAPEIHEHPRLDQPLSASAVLLALVQREGGLHVLLTQRASHLRNHSGQIAFAGGRIDAKDTHAAACALREAHEEIGLTAEHIEVLGTLAPYTTGSAFEITPVVALVRPEFHLHINPAEVDSAFEIALAHLMNPQHHHLQQAQANGITRHWWAMPSVDTQGQDRFVWGASAGILRNLYQFLRSQDA